MPSSKAKYTKIIKAEAERLGFFACGISKARFLEEEAKNLENYISENRFGDMQYMQNNFDKRLDPRKLVDGAKSVISLLFAYYPSETQKDSNSPIISKYAYGKDYHFLIKAKLKEFFETLQDKIGDVSGRVFTDTAPILERKWAELSGLGWIGKNANLLTKNGSFFFLSEIILNIELEYDTPIKSYCGTCTRCIDACPTQAIYEPYKIDANLCISYLTIEFRKEIPDKFIGKFENRFFGCDICQDVCPHNKKPIITDEEWFQPHEKLLKMKTSEWHEITQEIYTEIFRKSPVKRTKFSGVKRNLEFLQKKL